MSASIDLTTPAGLRSARESLGRSVPEMAAEIPATRQALYLWEAGKRPIPDWLVRLYEYFLGKRRPLKPL